MFYFNGFSLQNEEKLFSEFLLKDDLCVAGFSYGAQKAFEYVYHAKERINTLILLSPAFFQTQKPSFIRTQLHYFDVGQESYIKQFLTHVSSPSNVDLSTYLNVGSREELEALLTYQWDHNKIHEVLDRGTTIEVFLGEEDKIIQSLSAFRFFSSLTTTYLIKNRGHILT
jgi:pimeloyl-ACP methyl ester carboxylesterase